MTTFKALRIDKTDTGPHAGIVDFDEAALMPGNVTVRVSHSTVNYKDGLAITGRSPVVRTFPMIGGIDLAGTVETSDDPDFTPGDVVVLNGWGLGETHFGGYAEKARVKGEWLVKLPEGLTPHEAMAIGTAGYTAMLSVMALERHGLTPGQGPAVVTGAAGGVGSFALMLLKKAGWHLIASTGRAAEADYLKSMGADEIIDRAELSAPGKPLAKERWIAGVDSVGSHTLANLLAQTTRHGAVAACGLAQGMDLPASVAPFILRGVALLGIDSVYCPKAKREKAWARLARDLDRTKLRAAITDIAFDQVVETAHKIMDGTIRGRVVVTIA
jgi:acrylyl-CoA reductase (NADPH)